MIKFFVSLSISWSLLSVSDMNSGEIKLFKIDMEWFVIFIFLSIGNFLILFSIFLMLTNNNSSIIIGHGKISS